MKKSFLYSMILFAAVSLFGQEKVAYIHMGQAFEGFYKTYNANIIFEQKKKDYEARMTLIKGEVETAGKELKAVEEEAKNELLSQTAREEAVRKYRMQAERFAGKRDEFERARQMGLQELRKVQNDTEETLVKELLTVVESYANANGYTHVFDVSGLTMNRMPVLLVYPKQLDITKAFLRKLNEGHEEEMKAAATKLEALRGVQAAKAEKSGK